MEIYDFAEVTQYGSYVRFYCTDPKELDSVLKGLQKIIPSARMYQKTELPPGELFYYGFDKLENKQQAVVWWIVKQLCHRGWEPLGNILVDTGRTSYQLRRKNSTVL